MCRPVVGSISRSPGFTAEVGATIGASPQSGRIESSPAVAVADGAKVGVRVGEADGAAVGVIVGAAVGVALAGTGVRLGTGAAGRVLLCGTSLGAVTGAGVAG